MAGEEGPLLEKGPFLPRTPSILRKLLFWSGRRSPALRCGEGYRLLTGVQGLLGEGFEGKCRFAGCGLRQRIRGRDRWICGKKKGAAP